eukprot:c4188_g1_i1 orf=1-195(-)
MCSFFCMLLLAYAAFLIFFVQHFTIDYLVKFSQLVWLYNKVKLHVIITVKGAFFFLPERISSMKW